MLVRQSAIYVLARVMPGVVSMALTALLTRILGPASYGLYGVATLIMALGGGLLFDWLGVALVRIYSGARQTPQTLATFLQIYLLLSAVLASSILPVAAYLGPFTRDADAYAVGVLMVITYSGFELAARARMANLQAWHYLLMNLGRSLLILLFALPTAMLTHDGLWTALGTALGMGCGAMLGLPGAGIGGFRRVDRGLIREILIYGVPIAASMILGGLVNSGTRTLVGGLGSTEELGYYTAAFVLIQNTLSMLGSGLEAAAFPLAVAAVERGDEVAARDQLTRNATLLLAVLAPAALGMALTAPSIAHSLVGSQFEPTVAKLTPWMCAGGLFGALRANYLDHAFQLGRRPNLQVHVTALSGGAAIALAAWLIPIWGSVGAAMAVAAATGLGCLHALLAGRYAFPLPFPTGQAARILAACAVMAFVVQLTPGNSLGGFILQVADGAVTYAMTALALDVMGVRRMLAGRLIGRV
jgi:O-antigen/teichoic acid export membrane protein